MSDHPPRRAYPDDLTDDERRAIDSLVRLARRWPATLGIFSWSGALRVTDERDEVLDYQRDHPDAGDVRTIDNVPAALAYGIPNDGGDPYELP